MALNKRTYTDGITVITAGNLNDIQDAIIALEGQDVPAPYNSNPEEPGEASPGTSDEFARGDHVHPLPPVDSALSDSSENPVQNKVIKAALDDKADIIVSSATGPVASFADGSTLPVKDLTIAIEPVQSGSGDPAPDNVRPISGWTGAKVTRTGKNLLDTKSGPSTTTSSDITAEKNADGSYNVTGTASGIVNLWLRGECGSTTPIMKLYAGKTYFIKDCMLYKGTTQISPTVYMGQTGTYRPSADIEATAVRASTPIGTTIDTTIYPYITDSADTEWQPFGDTYSITFPNEAGTVYGGTLDVTTGKLTVDRAMADLGTLTWEDRYTEANNKTVLSHFPVLYPHVQTRNIIAENYKYYGFVDATTNLRHPDSLAVGLRSYYQTDFPQYDDIIYAVLPISDSPAGKVVYPLATPIEYDLTPVEVTTLLAQNNIWADTGDTTVQYRADTKLYIAAVEDENRQLRLAIAPIEDGATASQAYSQGKYFFRNGSFCKAKTSIASGASFTLNTNYEVTTVAAELFTALNS